MNTQLHRRRARGPHALAVVAMFVLALLFAQALGLAHRVLHHPHLVHHPHATQYPHATQHQSLFQHSDQSPDCRLFDQAGSADGLACVPAVALPMALSSFDLLYFQGEVLTRWVALFDARGPPSVR